MGKIESYKDLIAWQKAMDLVVALYKLTDRFPGQERFGLTSQTRRAATSIPANIAEGYGRRTRADYIRFLNIARASANETETQLLMAIRLEFISGGDAEEAMELIAEVQRILRGLINSLQRTERKAFGQ